MSETNINHKEKAIGYFMQGYNCSQAVVMAFAEDLGINTDDAAKMSVGLGGGVGRMREVCGTVTGMAVVLGLKYGTVAPDSKNTVYPLVQKACDEFKNQNGSIVCRELLAGTGASSGGIAEARTADFYKKRPCKELVGMAAEIVEKLI